MRACPSSLVVVKLLRTRFPPQSIIEMLSCLALSSNVNAQQGGRSGKASIRPLCVFCQTPMSSARDTLLALFLSGHAEEAIAAFERGRELDPAHDLCCTTPGP